MNRQSLLLLSLAIGAALTAFLFKTVQKNRMEDHREHAEIALSQIQETIVLKKLWRNNNQKKALITIKSTLPADKIKRFHLERAKASIELSGLSGKDLNRLLSRLSSLPLRFKSVKIERYRNEVYALECLCAW